MFGMGFDLFIAAVCVVLAVIFFLGKGKGILDAFSVREQQKKRPPEEQKKYEFGFGIFCVVLAAGELLMAFSQTSVWTSVAALAIGLGDLIFIGWYIRKF